jgi:GNAT superfamily N-acetyltransferase
MRIEIKSTSSLTPAQEKDILDWLLETFSDITDDYEWSAVDWHVLVWADGEMASHVEIVDRIGTVEGRRVKLGGIGGVMTRPKWQGRGYSSVALEAATAFMRDELGTEFRLLMCDQEMIPFYSHLGWQVVEGPLVFDQPGGKVTFDEVTMVLPCTKQEWPQGTIDLCGLPW